MISPGATTTGVFFTVCIFFAMTLPFLHRFVPPLTPTILGSAQAQVPGTVPPLLWDWLEPNEGWITWFPGGLPRERWPVKLVRPGQNVTRIPNLATGSLTDQIWIFDPVPEGQVGLLLYVNAGFIKTVSNNAFSPNSIYRLTVHLNGEVVLIDDVVSASNGYKKDINMFFPAGSGAAVRMILENQNAGSATARMVLFWAVFPDPKQEFGTMSDKEFATVSAVTNVRW